MASAVSPEFVQPAVLERGAKSPDVIFADADLEKAVPGAGMGVFGNSGQVCCAGTRVFVERSVYDEFVERSNNTSFGLGGGVWTRDVGKAHRLAAEIEAGVVWVNTYSQFDASMPFGGAKMSGWGNELSRHALDEYLNVKTVWIDTAE